MADNSAEDAVDALLKRVRAALGCVTEGTAFGTGTAEGFEHSVSVYAPGQSIPNVMRLNTYGGIGELGFGFTYLYTIVRIPIPRGRSWFRVDATFYQYRIFDLGLSEIVVYDWAPAGPSSVRTPHLHVPAAGSIILGQRAGSPLKDQKTFLGNLHLPTGHVTLENIVGLLIREFQVVPRRDDWIDILAANHEAPGTADPR